MLTKESGIQEMVTTTDHAEVAPNITKAFTAVLESLEKAGLGNLVPLADTTEATLRSILDVPIPETSPALQIALTLSGCARTNLFVLSKHPSD